MVEACSKHEEMDACKLVNVCQGLEGKRSLERPRLRWKNNIKVDFVVIYYGSIDRIQLAQFGFL
jgi:hypothetical protein